ncbi:LppA family lipoprotein [Prauserella flavalba]|uniref:LppA family lipoprotein n=1 Tax=Prauserella flavalba TaxID=1477506 RepID=UPI000D75F8A5|nr:LppA family lipoprotein [Prauserella flavalba]
MDDNGRKPLRLALGAFMIAALLGACDDGIPSGGPEGSMTGVSPKQKFDELAKRPDIEAVLKRYEQVRTEIRERLATEVGLPQKWEQPYKESETPCGQPYSDVREAIAVQMASWANDGRIAEDKWSRAQELFIELTGRHGFGEPQVVVDNPSKHEIRVYDAYGGSIMLGTEKATVLSARTGCHLAQGAHPRAKNAPA